ncbi:hypothetical protein BRC92_11735 [Halobacteriales archaeon QS_4_69_31]|nr:MAG: hypothetical protein BRC92_11735 [Halobacteriales archaeon QS_4_69_31]
MSDERGSRDTTVLAVSTVSMLAWTGAVLGAGYTVFALVTGGPWPLAALLSAVCLVWGAVFAALEHYLLGNLSVDALGGSKG